MSVSELVRTPRVASGLSQSSLAALADVPQPTISGIETGTHDATVKLVERLLAPIGYRLVAIPTQAQTVAETAVAVASLLRAGREGAAYRQLIQLLDDLAAESPHARVLLTATPPAPVGDRRYDAYIAAASEHRLREVKAPLPEWVHEPERVVDPVWYPAGIASLKDATVKITPPSFRRHGLIVDGADLVSV